MSDIQDDIIVLVDDKDFYKFIVTKVISLEKKMASLQDILNASREQQDGIKAALLTTVSLVKEVRQLIASGNIPDADAFLAEIQANSQALVAAAVENSTLANEVDAINGDPAIPAELNGGQPLVETVLATEVPAPLE